QATADTAEQMQAEKEVFGTTHGAVGAYLLGLWGIPQSIVEAVALHAQPGLQGERALSVLTVVHAANALVHAMDDDASLEKLIDHEYIDQLKLAERMEVWRDLAGAADL
ncbi:MAG: HDOD domain-containing protein, partial [Candidatus Thiodiazotropha sp.]